jgi:NAD(P)-dependent dehydrogenase (short-subunit alcohol dehydrogenase family)
MSGGLAMTDKERGMAADSMKVAIVTGGGSGIGRAACLRLARDGYAIAAFDLRDEAARETAAMIGDNALGLRCDVSSESEVKAAIDATLARFQRLDLVFHAAGLPSRRAAEQETAAYFDSVVAVSARGALLLAKYGVQHLRKTRGSMVNMSSVAALVGLKDRVAYNAAKGAIIAMSRGMAIDYAEDGVRVNAICPGVTETPHVRQAIADSADPEEFRRGMVSATPLGRFATPEEIADAVAYLASASFVTGHTLVIDGGMTAKGSAWSKGGLDQSKAFGER